VPDALRHHARPGRGQLSQHLLDEERVAAGARVHARRELVAAQQRASERRHVLQPQPAQVDAIQRAAALQLRQGGGQRGMPA
jgi:hypothetical protein